MMSFGWSTSCIGVGRLSVLLLALVVVACSYITNLTGFDTKAASGSRIEMAEQMMPLGYRAGEELSTFNVVGLNSHG